MISSLVTMIEASSVDSLGTNSAFIEMTSSILRMETSSTVVASTEEIQIQQHINSITGTIDTIIPRQSMVIMMLTDLGVAVPLPETTVPSPVPTVPSPVATIGPSGVRAPAQRSGH
jgi:hypothetical protein